MTTNSRSDRSGQQRTTKIKVVYFVHDQSDNSIARRVGMLVAGGASVTVAGFRRTPAPLAEIAGCEVIDLGETQDGKLISRVLSVVGAASKLKALSKHLIESDVILARNLEMLFLADKAKKKYAPNIRLVYECLDIHRLLLSNSPAGILLRMLENRLWKHVELLITSSPRFVSSYFEPRHFPHPTLLIENKVFCDSTDDVRIDTVRPDAPPWIIGWFGMIRCRKSFFILQALTQSLAGTVRVEIRGRPSPNIFPDFASLIETSPYISFEGPYAPEDLARIYCGVHFSWAIDYFEEGQNSTWLLPNRIYESTLFGAVPLAVEGTETANWIARNRIPTIFSDLTNDEMRSFFKTLSVERYTELQEIVRQVSRTDLVDDRKSCQIITEDIGR